MATNQTMPEATQESQALSPVKPAKDEPSMVLERAAHALEQAAPPGLDYTGASLLTLDGAEAEALAAPFGDEALDVKPTGEVFVSQVHYRRRLNQVFGPGQWAMVPRGKWTVDGNTMMREYVLLARGHFIAEAVGEQEYQPSNDRMTWADAAEGCKSNALTRACKDLGIASECWDRIFANHWRDEHCIHVWVKGKSKPQWRRLDALPFYGEDRPTDEWAATHARQPRLPSREPVEVALPPIEQRAAAAEAEPNPDYDSTAKPAPRRQAQKQPGKTQPQGDAGNCPMCGTAGRVSKWPKPGATYYCPECSHKWGDQ